MFTNILYQPLSPCANSNSSHVIIGVYKHQFSTHNSKHFSHTHTQPAPSRIEVDLQGSAPWPNTYQSPK